MRLFLGDQSVVITKDLFFVTLRRRTSVSAVFRVRVRTCCLRCGLGEPVGLRVYGLGSPRVVGVAAPSDPVDRL